MYLWAVVLIIYGSMFFIGVPANGILIWVYYKISKKRRMETKSALKGFTSTDLLLLGLAVIDFLACLAAPLQVFVLAIRYDWVCKFTFFMSRVTCLSTLFMTVALAVYRYHIVVRRKDWPRSPCIVGIVLTMCLALAFLTHGAVLVYAKQIDRGCIPFGSQRRALWIYRVFVVGIFVACLVIVLALYCRILWFLRKARSRCIQPMESQNATDQEPQCSIDGTTTAVTGSDSRNLKEPSMKFTKQFVVTGEELSRDNADREECREETGTTEYVSFKCDPNGHQEAEAEAVASASNTIPTVSGTHHASRKQTGEGVVHFPPRRPGQKVKPSDHLKATKMILIMTLIIYSAWVPYMLTLIFGPQIEAFLGRNHQPIVIGLLSFLIRLRDFVHVVNLFVYVAANGRFRKNCKEILGTTALARCLRYKYM